MSTKAETRSYPRKILRSNARVVLPGKSPMYARTVDVSLGGLCMMITEQIAVGQDCDIGFEAPLNGSVVRIFATGKVIYSILRGTDGFRTGVQFTKLDSANNKLLAELMI